MSGERDLPETIGRIAVSMTNGVLGSGELADLRRLDVQSPDRAAFWSVMSMWVSPAGMLGTEAENRWAMVLSGMARMAPCHHKPGRRVGEVLARVQYSEGRLMRLLRSRGRGFADTVRRTCMYLNSRGEPVDWVEFAAFILAQDPIKVESARRRIARDYYGTLNRKEKSS
jgi:CRISPR type I-E-associated protein CasB/Cse2